MFTQEQRDKAAQTRRINAEKRRAEKISAQGVGESKLFGGNYAVDENPVLNLHVGGVFVRDLPIESQGRILYQQTDEAIAERNEKARYSDSTPASGIKIGDEPFDKALKQRRDDLGEREMEPYEARDPLKEVADANARPGFRPKFLSPRRVKENGGTGDYEVVKDAKGDPVSVKGMILGQMPEARAAARNRFYQRKSNDLLKQITERYKQEGGPTAVADQ